MEDKEVDLAIAFGVRDFRNDELEQGATGKKMRFILRDIKRCNKIIDAQEGPVRLGAHPPPQPKREDER